ncbi:unnamed protein product, partial [Brassica oleracea]
WESSTIATNRGQNWRQEEAEQLTRETKAATLYFRRTLHGGSDPDLTEIDWSFLMMSGQARHRQHSREAEHPPSYRLDLPDPAAIRWKSTDVEAGKK